MKPCLIATVLFLSLICVSQGSAQSPSIKDPGFRTLSARRTQQLFTPTSISTTLDLTNAADSELQKHLGERITMHGRFSLRGKLGPFILAGGRPIYLEASGPFSWSKSFARMEGRDVRITGVLRFAHYPEPPPEALPEGRGLDHFYFEAETAKVRLNKR